MKRLCIYITYDKDSVVDAYIGYMLKELRECADHLAVVCNEEKGAELLKKYEKRKIFVVVKHPSTLLSLCEKGVELKEINVGGLYFKEGRRQISKTVYVDPEMEKVFQKLDRRGVKMENRTTPTDSKEDLMKLI